MEINLNKEEITETSEFINFSIREYVAEIRKKDKKKCWPFGSLGDPENDEDFASYQSAESIFLSSEKYPGDHLDGSDDTPEHTEAPNSTKVEMFNGKEDRSGTITDMIESLGIDDELGKSVYVRSSESAFNEVSNAEIRQENSVIEGAKSGSSVGADDNEPGRNQSRKKPQKFRLLSDISRDLAGSSGEPRAHCDRMNPNNVNSRFAVETKEELDDDVTLDAIFRNRKHVEVTLDIKKTRSIRVEEPRRLQDKKSKHRSKDSHVEVNSRFATRTTEDEVDDNVTLDVVFRKRKGVEATPRLKKEKRRIRVKEPRPVQDRKSMCKSKNSCGNDSGVSPRIHSRKTGIDDVDTQTMVKGKMRAPPCLCSKENVVGMTKDFPIPYCQKSNINAEVCSMVAMETANDESEMEAVMLLARHFNEEKKPSTDDQIPVELETVMGCACVQKKLREHLNEPISTLCTKTSSKTATKGPVFNADTSKKLTKDKPENAFCSVQMNHQSKGTAASVCQAHLEICSTKAAGAAQDAQNYSTLVCLVNRNPADFSIPNAGNKFMRGC